MGTARAAWNAAEHPRGSGGLFARKVIDVSEIRNQGVRSPTAFHPPRSAAERRAAKEQAPTKWRSAKSLYDRRARGERLSGREEAQISWASPRKMAEQRAKTGDTVVPRGVAATKIRHYEGSGSRLGQPRTGIKKTFTGRAQVERGNYRELLIPTADRPGSFDVRAESRVRRAFDWPRSTAGAPKPKPAAPLPGPDIKYGLLTDQGLRDLAASRGIEVPKRAGRNQIIKLIQGA